MAKLAEQHGWIFARSNGSHHVYTKEGRFERLVIPMHGNQTLKIGLQRSLMKIIPIKEEEL
jgi:predicted RNA binding protein YcfA (HicA-like mRNA interferase family)